MGFGEVDHKNGVLAPAMGNDNSVMLSVE